MDRETGRRADMYLIAMISANLGLVIFTILGIGLILYLAYTMIHPESF